MVKIILAIFLGGGFGSVLRYAVQLLVHEPYRFPWATFSVNVLGSLLIGIFYALSAKLHVPDEIRFFLTAGFCGGFTTFSTFSYNCLDLIKAGEFAIFAAYIIGSVLLGIIAAYLGYRIVYNL